MTNSNSILPFYLKASVFLVGLSALLAILYIAQGIILPLIFAFIIAILLNPVVSFLVRIKTNRIVAIFLALFLTLLIIATFIALIYSQVVSFSESWPIFVNKFTVMVNQTIGSASEYLHVKPQLIHSWITKSQDELIHINGALIGKTIVTVGTSLAILLLIPVYVFVILFYKPLLREFINRLFRENNELQISVIVTETKTVIQSYLLGLVIEAVIVAILNALGLMLLGIEYAILLGIIGALLNVIPFVGGIISVALYMMVGMVTKSSPWLAVYILIIHAFIQLIDNNFIIPKIVASKVKINALFSIIIVLVGNTLWGIPGMFLSIPLLAILKVIFDHMETLKPWGFLLGDSMPLMFQIKPILKRNKKQNT